MSENEIVLMKLDIIKYKLKGISLVVKESIKNIINKKKKNQQANNLSRLEIRDMISTARNDAECLKMFRSFVENKLSDIFELCCYGISLMKVLIGEEVEPGHKNKNEFWELLYEHFLKISFVHVEIFMSDELLPNNIKILDDGWESFLIQTVPLNYGPKKINCESIAYIENKIDEVPKTIVVEIP